jgi:hypothetical protein
MIDKTSRYAKTATHAAKDASGEVVELLELRPVPTSSGIFFHTPNEGERLDHLAGRYFRDPKKFWKICDASDVLDPLDVVVPGVPILIPPDK